MKMMKVKSLMCSNENYNPTFIHRSDPLQKETEDMEDKVSSLHYKEIRYRKRAFIERL